MRGLGLGVWRAGGGTCPCPRWALHQLHGPQGPEEQMLRSPLL